MHLFCIANLRHISNATLLACVRRHVAPVGGVHTLGGVFTVMSGIGEVVAQTATSSTSLEEVCLSPCTVRLLSLLFEHVLSL